MLTCNRCGASKEETEFNWRRRDRGIRDTYCRVCRRAYHREHYLANKDRYVEQALARTRRVRTERMGFLVEYLREHPCVDCGERDPVVLEFDHVRGLKRFNVSRGYVERSLEAVVKEIEKCEVVCANCHRRRTARRGRFAKTSVVDALIREGRRPEPPVGPSDQGS